MRPFDYSELFKSGDLVFDIGSHDGSGQAKSVYDLGTRLVCYEPVPQFAACIPQHCPNAIIEVKGVLDKPGVARITLSDSSPQSSSFSQAWIDKWPEGKWHHSIDCQITTLDLEIAKYGLPAYIAIDAEGMDDRVLIGLNQPVHALCFEYHPLPEFRIVYKMAMMELERLMYRKFNYITAAPLDKWQWSFDDWTGPTGLLYALDSEPKDKNKALWGRVFALWGE